MEIRARVPLSLPNIYYKVTLKYDTFQKATYDSYLMACLVANSKNAREANNYIDEITGKGSLNQYFKDLYEEISQFTEEQIHVIVNNSLYPITVIDQKHHFKYYPMFNATRMDNKVYPGNNRDNDELIKSLIMPRRDDVKFLSIDYYEENGKLQTDNYNAIFNDEEIKVDLDNGQYYPISKEDFNAVYKNDVENLNGYLGDIGDKITNGNWNVLSKSIVDTFSRSQYRYRDSNNIHSVLFPDFIKTIEVINVFGLYFYKETKYNFSKNNFKLCEDAVDYLMNSKNINEFKTKSLLNLLNFVDEKKAQNVIQYILGRKDSKEISELGLKLIKSGLEKGWEHDILLSIKKQIQSVDYKYLYRLDSNLNFDVEDLLTIDNIELTNDDRIRKEEYIAQKENLLKEINQMIGEMTNSGVREKIKKIPKSDLKDKVKKFLDKRIGHSKKDYSSMNVEQVTKEYNDIKLMYENEYRKILKEIDYLEKSK